MCIHVGSHVAHRAAARAQVDELAAQGRDDSRTHVSLPDLRQFLHEAPTIYASAVSDGRAHEVSWMNVNGLVLAGQHAVSNPAPRTPASRRPRVALSELQDFLGTVPQTYENLIAAGRADEAQWMATTGLLNSPHVQQLAQQQQAQLQ